MPSPRNAVDTHDLRRVISKTWMPLVALLLGSVITWITSHLVPALTDEGFGAAVAIITAAAVPLLDLARKYFTDTRKVPEGVLRQLKAK